MKVMSCLSPRVVFNRSLGRKVTVRCGKCEACLNARSANWVQRLDQEMYSSKYTFFVTFQYDELNVNQIILLRDEDNPNDCPTYIDSSTGQLYALNDCPNVTPKDIRFCEETKVLLIPSVSDFQKFLKRLRKDLKKNYNEGIRYYCTFEIGPTTFRPHAHSLFFTNSSQVAQNFAELCHKYWTYGSVFDPHLVDGSASQYVASYVNCFSNLPAIFLHPALRPKSVFSKKPPIGFNALAKEDRKRLFLEQKDVFTIFKPVSSQFCDVPLWRYFRNSVYRFIVKFGSLSYLDRVRLYGLGKIEDVGIREKIATLECLDLHYYINFYTLVRGSKYYKYNEDSFQKFLRTISLAVQDARDFGISIEYYVFLLSEYYDSLPLHQLKDYYLAQDDYFKNHPVSDFLLLNREFCLSVNHRYFSQLDNWQQFYIKMYLPDIDITKRIYLDYRKSYAFNELYKLHYKIHSDSTKTKEATDYLMANSSKFQNVINFKMSD